MATIATDPKLCKIIQRALIDYDGGLISQNQKPITGFLDSLISPINKAGVQQVNDLMTGATTRPGTTDGRKVFLRGMDANCTPCDGTATTWDRCNWSSSTDVATPVTYQYKVEKTSCIQKRRFLLSDIWKLCDDPNSIITENLIQMAHAIDRDVNTKLITAAVALMGDYNDGTDSKTNPRTLALLSANCASVNYHEFAKIGIEYGKSSYSGNPIVVGGDTIASIKSFQGNLGLNSNGVNLAGTAFPNMYTDYSVDSVYDDGDAHIITYMPKTFQLVEWFENEQVNSKFKGALINVDGKDMYEEEWSTIIIGGKKYDFFLKYDKCNGYVMALHKWFDLAEMPTTAFCNYPALQYLVASGTGSC